MSSPQAAIQNVQTFLLSPPGLDVALRISIAQPAAPVLGAPLQGPLDVIYATDADYCFGTVVEAARIAGSGGEMAPAIVVGIGYADENGELKFTGTRRIADFYRPPHRKLDLGAYGTFEFGKADLFLAALRDYVIPAVEERIGTVDPARRVLLGTSAGAHFAAYAMLQAPALFKAYALMSPVLIDYPADSGEAGLVRAVQDLPAGALPSGLRVFLSAGEHEDDPGTMFAAFAIISNALRLQTALARHGVTTQWFQVPGETHTSAMPAAISRALRFVLPPVAPPPDWQAALDASPSEGAKNSQP